MVARFNICQVATDGEAMIQISLMIWQKQFGDLAMFDMSRILVSCQTHHFAALLCRKPSLGAIGG